MTGTGTLINAAAILAGGAAGLVFGRFFTPRHQEAVMRACGVSTLFIGMAGALEGMLTVCGAGLASRWAMQVTLCLVIGAVIGEFADFESRFESFGEWLKARSGSSDDAGFVSAFVTASLTVCIGAMAIVGSIEDGLSGDPSILMTKAVLDFVIILVMTSAMGRGCLFSAIPVAALQGGMTLLASLIRPVMTDAALAYLSAVGSILIFCVGINLIWGRLIRVANLLPAVVIAVAMAFLPI
ncbi:MAG: DUF554 domain-containing protein [Mailhella sp.]|nr:DUF554 domain-containing protein [Mailhella sp.]